ncbi:MAG TPA: hypothetical protein VM223_19965 [Planctomycetota bacterium]|nr:hypothetical protein [Planctomycetota bacterium]
MQTRTHKCIDLLANAVEPLTDAQLAEATGLTAKYIARVRANPDFIAEVNRRAKQQFLTQMPKVLAALADAAADGKNASAMKLFLDACRLFESAGTAPGDDPAAAELLQRIRDAGLDEDTG